MNDFSLLISIVRMDFDNLYFALYLRRCGDCPVLLSLVQSIIALRRNGSRGSFMTTTTNKFTLDQYLAYENGTERRYELVDGDLVEMPPESDRNNLISLYLLSEFLKFVPLYLIRHKDTEIVVTGNRLRVRLPDLLVLTEELFAAIGGGRATITADMPSPMLVVEVVSPGKANEDRDYRYKRLTCVTLRRTEYAARGIPEYWIVDPGQAKVTVLVLVDGLYEETVFQSDDLIVSVLFPAMALTVSQVIEGGKG